MIKEAQSYIEVVKKHYIFDDWQGMELLLATVAAHFIPGQMFWVRLIGGSGTGKSDFLDSIAEGGKTKEPENSHTIDADYWTAGSMRGGYSRKVDKGEKASPRLVEEWNGKLVVTRDLAAIITKKQEEKGEVFGLIRNAWDGKIDAYYGSDEGHVTLRFHFDWIAGVTSVIESQRKFEATLGTRFVDLRWLLPQDEQGAILAAMNNEPEMKAIKEELTQAMREFILAASSRQPRNIKPTSWTADMVRYAANWRTPISRGQSGEVYELPDRELGTRFGQGIWRMVKGLDMIGITNYKPYVKRLALDSLGNARRAVVKAHLIDSKPTMEQIAEVAGSKAAMSTLTTARHDLELLGCNREALNRFEEVN